MKSTQTTGANVLKRKTIFVSVTDARNGRNRTVLPTTPLPDIARGWWHAVDAKINQCELLAAVDNGVVVGIWEIDRNFGWRPMAMNTISTRVLKPSDIEPKRKYCRLLSPVSDDNSLIGKPIISINGMKPMRGPIQYKL